jgi:vesicle-fusing ATPase
LGVNSVRHSSRAGISSLLLHGPSGSGKTALAAKIAVESDFPFVKMISPESLIGLSEQARVNQITGVFASAYKSRLSLIVLDGIERLLEYVPIGPRFSNAILQTLQVCLQRIPPDGRRLLVVSTTSRRALLADLDLVDCFTQQIYVPSLTDLAAVLRVLAAMDDSFTGEQLQEVVGRLMRDFSQQAVQISIKALINLVQVSRQDPDDPVGHFMHAFLQYTS